MGGNMAEVERLSTRVVFIHHGRVIADGRLEQVLHGKATLEEFFLALARAGDRAQP